jgi:hypothetical protein
MHTPLCCCKHTCSSHRPALPAPTSMHQTTCTPLLSLNAHGNCVDAHICQAHIHSSHSFVNTSLCSSHATWLPQHTLAALQDSTSGCMHVVHACMHACMCVVLACTSCASNICSAQLSILCFCKHTGTTPACSTVTSYTLCLQHVSTHCLTDPQHTLYVTPSNP